MSQFKSRLHKFLDAGPIALALFLILGLSSFAFGDDADSVAKTQQMMTNSSTRQQMLNTPGAKNADAQATAATATPEQKERLYKLAADLLPEVAQAGNNDPNQMNKMLEQAQKNPEGFYSTWTPEQQANFQRLVRDIDQARGGAQIQP